MQASQIPVKFPIPFAADAGAGFIRPIPVASQITITPGAASLTDGFPPLNFIAEGSGGIPPFGQDENGILNQITAWSQWQNAGATVLYDSAFSTAIGGYPKGALLYAASGGFWWLSTVDNNATDPDTGGAGWQIVASGQVYAGNPNGSVAGFAGVENFLSQSFLWDTTNKILWLCTTTGNAAGAIWTQLTGSGTGAVWCNSSYGTVNAQIITVPNSVQSLSVGTSLSWKVGAGLTNTGALTLVVGGFGTIPVYKESITGPAVLIGGEVVAGNILTGTYDGTYIQLTGIAQGTAALANASSQTGIVAAVSGSRSITPGHLAVFSDALGTVEDGGPVGVSAPPTYINSTQVVGPGIYLTDTSAAAFALTLTATPATGTAYEFIDAPGTWSLNSLTINRNGKTIMGIADNLICNNAGLDFRIWYNGSTWRLE